jgi:hypothetical protein
VRLSDILKRLDEIIAIGNETVATCDGCAGPYDVEMVRPEAMARFRAASLSFIERVYGKSHSHYLLFTSETPGAVLRDAQCGLAILQAIQSELQGGWLFTVTGLVAAELFSDFLEMAQHLLYSGYKDSAAVMIGSVLEEHLRQLCLKHDIGMEDERDGKMVPRKADRLNAELEKNDVYSKLDQKLITAWLDLRNNAAHGKYQEYTEEQVRQQLSGATEFMARVAL